MTSTAEILKAARKLIEKPENWTTGLMATNRVGLPTRIEKGDCFCSLGAIARAIHDDGGDHLGDQYNQVKDFLSVEAGMPVSWFNDRRNHQEVLYLFSKAIAAAEASS